MSISERIRLLGREGKTPSEIAKVLGVSYQHAYTVLRQANLLIKRNRDISAPSQQVPLKPALTKDILLAAGFVSSALWKLSGDGEIESDRPLPKEIGVYAFAKGDSVLYVGVATMGLSKRLYFYRKPGASQKTSVRINALIKDELKMSRSIEVLTAQPDDLEWNGMPVSGAAGLELGLIKRFQLLWNIRSAG